MKRTQPEVIAATLLQRDILLYHIDYIIGPADLFYRVLVIITQIPSTSQAFGMKNSENFVLQ